MNSSKPRMIVWFSCGAASAVAAYRAIQIYGTTHEVVIVYCDTLSSEHPDNKRFMAQCSIWFGQPVLVIRNLNYQSVDDVFERTRYMAGVRGARCTTELKKIPRLEFASPDDIHVFGYTANEERRIKDFEKRNPDLNLLWILRDAGVTKSDCYKILMGTIRLPTMYLLGFDNNNCPGCVKAGSPWYWDMTRRHFPETFQRRCKQSREIGVRLVECSNEVIKKLADGVVPEGSHRRIFLDELPPGPFQKNKKENLSCGPECGGAPKVN